MGLTRTWQTSVPQGTERLIIDAPAGVCGQTLQEMVRRTDVIVVPVAPSSIDIHATSEFMCDLLLIGKIRKFGIQACVVANRVRRESPQYEPLKLFLNSLKIPFVTSLADTDHYITAAETGVGIHEMDEHATHFEREQWAPLIQWLGRQAEVSQRDGGKPALRVANAAGA
jgi:chromosome partitioning protein